MAKIIWKFLLITLGLIVLGFLGYISYQFIIPRINTTPSQGTGNLPIFSTGNGGAPVVDAFNKNDFATAIAQSDTLLASDPNNIVALLAKATTLAQEGSINFKEAEYGAKAIAVAQQVLAIDPKNSEAWRIIGYANEIQQKYTEAHTAYAKSIALNPKNAAAISDDAHAWDLQGNAAKAKAGYTQALAIDPTIDIANLGMARVLIAEKNSQAALPFINRVIATSQNIRFKAEADFMEGSIETSLHNHTAAQSLFEQATTVDPSFPLGWFGLGRELFAQASDASLTLSTTQRNALAKQSIQDFIQATNLNPNQSIAYMQLGMELIYIGQKDNGIKALQNAAIVVPNDITLSTNDKKTILAQINALLKLFRVA